MNARDELAKAIITAYGEDADAQCPCTQDLDVADAILAAGYRKPRTITTVEELDAAPKGSVVMGDDGKVFIRETRTLWHRPNRSWDYDSDDIDLPATVLFEPEAAS